MEESEKELECKNCGKMITESKFDLHEAYCLRNIIRCTKCNEPINKNEVEEHNEQFHTPVQCQYCKQQFEKPKLEDHLKICNCQPQICTFCQLPISKKEIYIHEKQCGSRTEICEYCKSRIQLNQLDEHKIYCKINEEMKKEEQKYEKQFPALNEQKSSKPKSQISPQIHKPQSKASKKDQKSVPQMKQSNKPQQQYQQKQEQKAANKKQNLYEEMLAHTFQSNGNYGASSQEFAEQFNKQQLDAIAYDQMNQFNFPQDQDYQEKYSNVYDALENINPQPGFEESIFSSQQKQHQQQQKLHKPKSQQNQEQLPKSQIQKEISQDDDEMIQRVIEMSLQDGWKQPVVGDLGSTMDSEAFKRALEKSKYEK